MARKTQIEKAIAALDADIAVLVAARARLELQRAQQQATRQPTGDTGE